jgi:hypothetical protein
MKKRIMVDPVNPRRRLLAGGMAGASLLAASGLGFAAPKEKEVGAVEDFDAGAWRFAPRPTRLHRVSA